MTLAKQLDLFSAVWTFQVAEILHQTEHRHMHHLRHVVRLFHDHLHEFLRGRHNHDSVYRKRLEHRKRYIAGSRRHIHEQIVHVSPDCLVPELFYHAGNHRSSPDDRCLLVIQQQVDRHDLDTVLRLHRNHSIVRSVYLSMNSEHLRNRRTGNIRIHDAYLVSGAVHRCSE